MKFKYFPLLLAAALTACTEPYVSPEPEPSAPNPSEPFSPEPLQMGKVTCTDSTASSLTFVWHPVPNAEGYVARLDSGSYDSFRDTLYVVSGLEPSTAYTLSVYADADGTEFVRSSPSYCTARTAAKRDTLKPSRLCPGWFELPAQKDGNGDGIDDDNPDLYYSWTMRADAPRIRNFSACYSKSKIHPVWVAAPMHSCYKGSSGRTGGYQNDPAISCAQSSKFDGYTRGHMVGSYERTVSAATNRQVFYYSNIGAQLQTGFNTGGGVWNNLESAVDGQWCSDTLYQVVGCIFETFTDRYGVTVEAKTGTNAAGSAFQVPTAYYKVLLRTKGGNTGKRVDQCAASELKAAAFIVAHKGSQGRKPSVKDLYSVSEVEALTGLTFFVNVPNAPKTSYDASDWL